MSYVRVVGVLCSMALACGTGCGGPGASRRGPMLLAGGRVQARPLNDLDLPIPDAETITVDLASMADGSVVLVWSAAHDTLEEVMAKPLPRTYVAWSRNEARWSSPALLPHSVDQVPGIVEGGLRPAVLTSPSLVLTRVAGRFASGIALSPNVPISPRMVAASAVALDDSALQVAYNGIVELPRDVDRQDIVLSKWTADGRLVGSETIASYPALRPQRLDVQTTVVGSQSVVCFAHLDSVRVAEARRLGQSSMMDGRVVSVWRDSAPAGDRVQDLPSADRYGPYDFDIARGDNTLLIAQLFQYNVSLTAIGPDGGMQTVVVDSSHMNLSSNRNNAPEVRVVRTSEGTIWVLWLATPSSEEPGALRETLLGHFGLGSPSYFYVHARAFRLAPNGGRPDQLTAVGPDFLVPGGGANCVAAAATPRGLLTVVGAVVRSQAPGGRGSVLKTTLLRLRP